MKLNIPDYIKYVINTLKDNGFEAFVVGGAVRDAMLGQCPDDWDVTTNALPEETKKCFDRHFDTGIKHGTITVLSNDKPVEVTTYRIDGDYSDNRHPEDVKFTSKIADDLKRRDFTVNAMAYNDDVGLVDLYGGEEDLKNRIIRCVGDADIRFGEDALRILRAIRFALKLGFDIDEKTLFSIGKNCYLLENISAERIQAELLKMLETDDDLHLLFQSGVGDVIIPEVNFDDIKLSVPADKELKLAALLYNVADQRIFFNRLKFDNKTKNNVLKILECSRGNIEGTDYAVKKSLNKYGKNLFEKSLMLMECYGKNVEYLRNIFNRVKTEPYTASDLDITGNDIIHLGFTGKDVGRVMDALLDNVMKTPCINTKEKLLDIAIQYKI